MNHKIKVADSVDLLKIGYTLLGQPHFKSYYYPKNFFPKYYYYTMISPEIRIILKIISRL